MTENNPMFLPQQHSNDRQPSRRAINPATAAHQRRRAIAGLTSGFLPLSHIMKLPPLYVQLLRTGDGATFRRFFTKVPDSNEYVFCYMYADDRMAGTLPQEGDIFTVYEIYRLSIDEATGRYRTGAGARVKAVDVRYAGPDNNKLAKMMLVRV